MKKFYKGLIAAVLFVAVALSTVVTSYASAAAIGSAIKDIAGSSIKWAITPVKANKGEDELVAAKKYLDSVWRPLDSTDGTVEVTYQTLSDVLADLNMNGIPCQLKQLRGAGPVGYVIVGAGTAPILDGYGKYYFSNKYFTNTAGAIFRADKDSGGGTTGNTYNYNHTTVGGSSVAPSTHPRPGGSVSSVVTDRELQERIYHSVDSLYQYMSLIIDWLRFVDQDICRIFKNLNDNVVPALEAINNNIISFKNSAVSSLRAAYSVLSDSYDVQFNLLGVARSIYSGVSGIAFRLDSVISNGVVQVNTTSLEARLDKLISMYSKVNSVVLDTASVNGGQIKDAVGGELKDVMFWGDTAKVGNTFVSSNGVAYSLNDVKTTVNGLTLRSVNLGSTIPSYIANDPVLYAGVWRKGTDYIISDTYNASTGEYVQRVETITFNRETVLRITQFERANGRYVYALALAPDTTCPNRTFLGVHSPINCTHADGAYYGVPGLYWGGDSSVSVDLGIVVGNDTCILWSSDVATVSAFESWLYSVSPAVVINYVPVNYAYWAAPNDPVWSPTVRFFDPSTIAIPEGGSTISAEHLRITGKYETYDSYTQTADIITAINNIPPYDDAAVVGAITKLENALSKPSATVTADLTEVTSRLDLILAELQSTSGSASCEHTYTQHMEQDADCILPGLMISTCSQCGDSYSEIVDPLGHDWVLSSHVDAVTDPDTGEETASAYDVYTCSRCGRTYEDHTGNGAPVEDYSNTSISQLVVQVFSKLGTFAGKLISFFVHLLDKALTSVDNVISKFNDYTAQISSFGGSYPAWLTGFWGIIPSELQAALTFSVICMVLGAVGKKLLFS